MGQLSVQVLRAAMALVTSCSAAGIRASPPIPDDVLLTMRLVSTTDPRMLAGARVVLAFDVSQLGPTERVEIDFLIFTRSAIEVGPTQPIRLVEVPGSQCDLYADDSSGSWVYTLSAPLPPIGESFECTVEMDVLATPAIGYLAQFTAEVNDQKNGWDPNPSNNNVALLVGRTAGPVPLPLRRDFLATLVAAIVVAGALRNRRLRTSSRRYPTSR